MANAKLEGSIELKRNVKTFRRRLVSELWAGLFNAGDFLLKKSNERVPIEDGDLIASAKVEKTREPNTKAAVNVGYTSSYAAEVHEAKGTMKGKPRRSGKGNYWDPAATPKFLYNAIMNNSREIVRRMVERVKF